MSADSERTLPQTNDVSGNDSHSTAIIRVVQEWIDHPSWDSQVLLEIGDDDIRICMSLLSTIVVEAGSHRVESEPSIGKDDRLSREDIDEEIVHIEAPGRFSFVRVLGVGGFGVVLCVFDRILQRNAALKIMRPSLRYSRILQRRFLREVQVATSLEHPGILTVLETGRLGGHPYILMDVVDGPDLSHLLCERRGPATGLDGQMSESQAVTLIMQVAEALQFAHERGVLHRDLKPSNILLQRVKPADSESLGFLPRLTDFGLAKRIDHLQDDQDNLSAGVQLMGTLRYMSPEQAAGKFKDVGIASDIYSLGAILYQCVTGTTPYDGSSHAELLTKILQDPVTSPRRLNHLLSKDLDNIILKCLSREPRDRYPSAGGFAADLQQFLRGEPVNARKANIFRRLRFWIGKNLAVAAMAASLLVVMVAALIIVSLLYVREREAVDLALSAIHESYSAVADEVLDDVPNMTEKRLELYLMQIGKLEALSSARRRDTRSRYALSIAYSRAATAAGRLAMRNESRQFRQECLNLLEELLQNDPNNLNYQYDVFFNRKAIASEFYGPGSTAPDRIAMKEAVHHDGLRLLKLAPQNRYYRDAVASCKYDLAIDYLLTDTLRAESFLREAFQISDDLWNENPNDLIFVKYSLLARANLATHYRGVGRIDEAEQLLDDAIRILDAIKHPERFEAWFELVEREPLRSLLDQCLFHENWKEAAVYARRCLEIDTRLNEIYPTLTPYLLGQCEAQIKLLCTERHLGEVRDEASRIEEIESLLAKCETRPDGIGEVPRLRAFLSNTSTTPIP